MKYGLTFSDDTEFDFFGNVQISMGSGLDLSQRYAHDHSNRPQTITYRRRKVAKTGTINLSFTRNDTDNLFQSVAEFESLAGRVGRLFWNGLDKGRFCIKSVQFSLAVDCVNVINAVQIGLELQEGFQQQRRKTPKVNL